VEHDTWALEHHLLPYFAEWPLADISIAAVDDYRRFKVTQAGQRRQALEEGRAMLNRGGQPLRPMAAVTINKTLDVLQAILALALEYGHTTHNPAAGRRRRLRQPARRRVHLDSVAHIEAALDAARLLDADSRRPTRDRYPQVATLLFAGPRAHELCLLRWSDVDLATGTLRITKSKTPAGLRDIRLLPINRAALRAHRHISAYPAGGSRVPDQHGRAA
jgi:integrase